MNRILFDWRNRLFGGSYRTDAAVKAPSTSETASTVGPEIKLIIGILLNNTYKDFYYTHVIIQIYLTVLRETKSCVSIKLLSNNVIITLINWNVMKMIFKLHVHIFVEF